MNTKILSQNRFPICNFKIFQVLLTTKFRNLFRFKERLLYKVYFAIFKFKNNNVFFKLPNSWHNHCRSAGSINKELELLRWRNFWGVLIIDAKTFKFWFQVFDSEMGFSAKLRILLLLWLFLLLQQIFILFLKL